MYKFWYVYVYPEHTLKWIYIDTCMHMVYTSIHPLQKLAASHNIFFFKNLYGQMAWKEQNSPWGERPFLRRQAFALGLAIQFGNTLRDNRPWTSVIEKRQDIVKDPTSRLLAPENLLHGDYDAPLHRMDMSNQETCYGHHHVNEKGEDPPWKKWDAGLD